MKLYFKAASILLLAIMLFVYGNGVALADGPDGPDALWSGRGHGTITLRRLFTGNKGWNGSVEPVRLKLRHPLLATEAAPNEAGAEEGLEYFTLSVYVRWESRIYSYNAWGGSKQTCDTHNTPGVDRPLPGIPVTVNGDTKHTGPSGMVSFNVRKEGDITVSVTEPADLVSCNGTSITFAADEVGYGTKIVRFAFRLP